MLIPPIYKPQKLTLTLVGIEKLNDDVFEYHFKPSEKLEFEPGQFINLDIPNEAKRVVRSYSIASAPHEEEIVLCIKLVNGPGSNFFRKISVGTVVTGMGPFGLFALKEEHKTPLLFVGTGTGIAPLKSMIEHLRHKGNPLPMTLFFGVRNEKDAFYDQLFCSYEKEGLDYQLTLSQPTDDEAYKAGRVTKLLTELRHEFQQGGKFQDCHTFICGNGAMIEEVVKILTDFGLHPNHLHHEKFF